jgi:hypothetical protein
MKYSQSMQKENDMLKNLYMKIVETKLSIFWIFEKNEMISCNIGKKKIFVF